MQQKVLILTGKLSESSGKFVVDVKDMPEPGPGYVLVEVHAAALNPIDCAMADTGLFVKEWPLTLGFDAAGVVKKLGEGVTHFAVGDKVMHAGTHVDPAVFTFQQYVVMRAEFVAKVPSNITLDQAATIPLTMATAALGLYDKKQKPFGGIGLTPPWEEGGRGKYAGEPIVILGGASGVGQHAIQFAKISGFSPIITTASTSNEEYLKSLGATQVVDRNLPLSELSSLVKQITDKPVKYGFGAIGTPDAQDALYDVVASGGQLLLVKQPTIDEAKLAKGDKYVGRVFADVHLPAQQEVGRGLYAHLTRLVEAGDIKPTKLEVLPNGLAGIPEGLQRLKKGVSALKFVARPQETP
ncbi:uncharacterized protein PHACADRAFT_253077 [Phanerochaete carnosa HHB-10118-sp]|uniref:Enoyl reductase (ER) domain-containing protein n=1 Tax=Phanerochaete carnosa (strain HHB-10118-sp) TaxID=650164 RepID=K5W3Z2_PHACS|nr:uncharacterized protein PHACADRAFT_253077 [Phanerochaete carnosa HHB-10118-sp]EKM58613.1 hypothetical protein PHACADRAFT_253077 [Phanerochaete carnosa HHB-10118-sp]